jgi:peptidoglycan/LPS O-acetylase OafA/YrhL
MTRLGDFRGRDNNFNLIRFLAAILVIWSHAFGLLDHPRLTLMDRGFGLGPGDLGWT